MVEERQERKDLHAAAAEAEGVGDDMSDTPLTDAVWDEAQRQIRIHGTRDVINPEKPCNPWTLCKDLERALSAEREQWQHAAPRHVVQSIDCSYGDTPGAYHCPIDKPCDMCKLRKRADDAEAKLAAIRRIPLKPFPDPGGHSWMAFGNSVYHAWSDIQRIAREVKNG